MKKPLLLGAVIAIAVVIFFSTRRDRPAETAPTADNAATPHKMSAPVDERSARALPEPQSPSKQAATNPADNEVIAALRKALAADEYQGLEAACSALKAYIEAHPERVDEFVAFMRSEVDEHVLRQFTLVLAQTEVGLLANEKIISAAIELAKDPSFEQRQHIMLHLMAQFPEMYDQVFAAISEISQTDPSSQVKTSAVVAMADYMEKFPDETGRLLATIGDVFKTASDEDVRLFSYQVLALHKEQLSSEMFSLIGNRFSAEQDSYAANLLACALFAAPENVRSAALQDAQRAFENAADPEDKRNRLLQLVAISQGNVTALLEQLAGGKSALAEDARSYLPLIAGGHFEPQMLLADKTARDGNHASCDHPEHQKN